MNQAVERAFLDGETTSVLTGWVEAVSESEFEADLSIVVETQNFASLQPPITL
jgi:hypothetical protein